MTKKKDDASTKKIPCVCTDGLTIFAEKELTEYELIGMVSKCSHATGGAITWCEKDGFSKPKRTTHSTNTVKELKSILKDNGITGYSSMTKDQLHKEVTLLITGKKVIDKEVEIHKLGDEINILLRKISASEASREKLSKDLVKAKRLIRKLNETGAKIGRELSKIKGHRSILDDFFDTRDTTLVFMKHKEKG